MERATHLFSYLFGRAQGKSERVIARWLFLRALGLIYFSAFFSLLFQILGLIGSKGILPAGEYLQAIQNLGVRRFWDAPTLLWISSTDTTIQALCWIGIAASVFVVANVAPRWTLAICFVCFLSFVSAAQDFSGYQSDGMLLEAGFLALFMAPRGVFPGWGENHLPSRAAVSLLIWEWFRIYFQSGLVKLASGDPAWRNLTAMYEYYQNGPLPTWIGWYLQHLPNWFHVATAGATIIMELVLVWMAFLPRPWRLACFFLVTMWQVGVILTANYAFLNYLVLVIAVFLLDDQFLLRFIPAHWERRLAPTEREHSVVQGLAWFAATGKGLMLSWIFYATAMPLLLMLWPEAPLPIKPVAALDSFRIANQYGLFAVMTPHRYEIEFQGSDDARVWTAYPFRYKPQNVKEPPGIYAPYQPRFDWNLWFASLGQWQQYPIVPRTEELLLENDQDVLGLFAGNPFPHAPPRYVRAVRWQYWFSNSEEKRTQGIWWRRDLLTTYAPTLTRLPNGRFGVIEDSLRKEAQAPFRSSGIEKGFQ